MQILLRIRKIKLWGVINMGKKSTNTGSAVSRRQFGAAAGVAAVAAGTPIIASAHGSADSASVSESIVSVQTENGAVQGFFAHPSKGQHPGVLTWRNGGSLGLSSRNEARRLAGQGYSVLVLDRDGGDARAVEAETLDAVAWLEKSNAVNAERGVGTPMWAQDHAKAQRHN